MTDPIGQDGAANSAEAAQLGFVHQILFRTPRRALNIASVYLWIWPAIRLRQIVFLIDARNVPIGYATWSYLSEENSLRMERDEVRYLEIGEWNEGTNLWITDFVAPKGHVRRLARVLRNTLNPIHKSALGLRRDASGTVTRLRRIRQA